MEVMLILLAAIVGVGAVLYALHQIGLRREASKEAGTAEDAPQGDAPVAEAVDDACCGMHITCEKDSLLASVSSQIEYYDDEELDAYRGRNPEDYSETEIEQFRDVLLTLLPTDIAGWGRSLQLRGIALPSAVREELIMIVAEARRYDD